MMQWHEKLTKAGFPTTVLVIDFESYYGDGFSLNNGKSKVGNISTVEYVTHEKFELIGCGFGYMTPEDGLRPPWFTPKPKLVQQFRNLRERHGYQLENITVVAKNCKFDMLILAVKFGIYPKYTVDCDDLTRTFDARMKKGMAEAAPFFGIGYKGDTTQFKNLHYAEIVDKGLLPVLEEYTLNDIDIEQQWIEKLMPIVDNPEIELPLAAHTLKLYTKPVIDFDFDLCEKLIADMTQEIKKTLRDITPWVLLSSGFSEEDVEEAFEYDVWVELVSDIISKDLRFVPLLRKALPQGQEVPLKEGGTSKLRKDGTPNNMALLMGVGNIPALAKNDDGCKWLIAHPDSIVSSLMAARLALNSWPSHIKRLTQMRNQSSASAGKFRVPLKFYGAHTGRWSGEERVNANNLGGTGRGKAISKLISQMRHTLCAPIGCSMGLVDAAQIEARNLAWYAKQDNLLELYRAGGDPYSDLASTIFKCKVWKWNDDKDVEEYPGHKAKLKVYRGFGKDAILGCGYGMGWQKFYNNCLQNDSIRPLFDSGEYTEGFIKGLITVYRTKYNLIPKFWRTVEKAWRKATRYRMEVKCGHLVFSHSREESTTYIRLPSGRRLRYRNARVDNQDRLKYRYGDLWGGSLTENIVQATCRDFLAGWILEIERLTDNCIVHHVYDEIIAIAGTNEIKNVVSIMTNVMSRGPEWAGGMPFEVEHKIANHYIK